MEGVLSEGMCRCCASEGSFKDFQVPYQWMGVEEIYSNMMKDCFDISLMVTEDGNNGGICEVCITQLRNAFNFKLQVQQTEQKFKRKLEERSFKDSIKMELSRDGDDDSNMSGDFSSNDYEVPIKVEKVEDKPKKRQAAKASTSKAKKSKASPGETSTKRLQQQITIVTGDKADEILRKIQASSTITVKKKRNTHEDLLVRVQEVDKHRNNFIEIMSNSNATPIRSRSDMGYSCCFCNESYIVAADLKKHTIEEHDEEDIKTVVQEMKVYTVKLDITALKCTICCKDLSSIEDLMEHLIEIHNRTIYTDIKNHMIPFKFDDDYLRCAICSTKCSTFRNLTEHMNKHYRNYLCSVCGAGFVNRDILRSHIRIHKTGTFKCDLCSKVFNTKVKKQSHINKSHRKIVNKCGYCEEMFVDYHKKSVHLAKVHGAKPLQFTCDICDRRFPKQYGLTVHIRKDHLMERNFECDHCRMRFFGRKDLQKHMLRHTGQRDFHCELCGKAFARKSTLSMHMKVHTKERRVEKARRESADRYLIVMDSDVEYDIQ